MAIKLFCYVPIVPIASSKMIFVQFAFFVQYFDFQTVHLEIDTVVMEHVISDILSTLCTLYHLLEIIATIDIQTACTWSKE